MSELSKKTLWLIDDDFTFRYVFRCIVESHNLVDEFVEFENGEVALHALMDCHERDQQPYVILVDIHMPVLDGWGFLEKLQALPQGQLRSEIYLISSSIAEVGQRSGATYPQLAGHVSKPISVDKICAVL